MIQIAVKKRFHSAHGGQAGLDLDMDMEVAAGECVAVFGKSGAGKTTLLRMLAGLTAPDSGRILVAGETWYDSARGIDLPPQRRRAGLVFQDYALFPNMTVRQNLAYALKDGADPGRVEEILAAVHLEALAARRPETLSGGEKQRVALARALASGPSMLLLDEPLSALDQELRLKLQGEIAIIQKRYGLATILVSHDPGEIARLSQRVLCLEEGRIRRAGRPGDVFRGVPEGDGFRLSGVILAVEAAGVAGTLRVITLIIGSGSVGVTVPESEAEGLRAGDKVFLAATDFNPKIIRPGTGAEG